MTNIDNTRSNFFPNSKTGTSNFKKMDGVSLKRNTYEKQSEIDLNTKKDAKVDIPDAIKDFSKIKKVVDATPERDNSAKIEALKQQIAAGNYKMDYDAIADKLLGEEFGHGHK
jgi:negative regulator of flagellin synthesis FlgM